MTRKKKSDGNDVSVEDLAGKFMADGDTMFRKNNWAGAIKVYEKGVNYLPKSHGDRATFYDKLSYCLMRIDPIDYNMVVRQCSEALRMKPDDSRPLLRRAQAYEALGKVSMALLDIRKLLQAQPAHVKAKDMLQRLSIIEELQKKRAIELQALVEEWEKEAYGSTVDKELEDELEKEGSVSSLDLAAKWEEKWEKRSSVSDEMEELNKTGSASNEMEELEIMELSFEKLFSRLFGKEEMRILMAGLDAAGKTTILYKLKPGDIVTTIPNVSVCITETLEYKNINFSVWDVRGQDKRHDFHRTHGLIFVVDSNDRGRVMEARDELHRMLNNDELRDAVLLVFANKQDLPNAMNTNEISDKLELHSLCQQCWHIQGTCASSGDGLYEGLEWLSKNIAYKDFRAAEVRTDVDHLGYIWAPATFIRENGDGTLRVKFVTVRHNFNIKTSLATYKYLGGGVEEDVSLSKIRPSPPAFGLKAYSLFEKVDALLESGWCPGVVTKVFLGRKYSVSLGRDNQSKYVDYWQLRPRTEWKDRIWQTYEEDGLGSKQNSHVVEDEVEELNSKHKPTTC